jgi:TonB family protein
MRSHLRYPGSLRRDHVTGTAEFAVTVLRTGDITTITLLRSSGNTEIDLIAEVAIRDSSPLPPSPPDFPGDKVFLRGTFTVDPDHPSQNHRAAAIRRPRKMVIDEPAYAT